MSESKFAIKQVYSIRFLDKDGNEIPDIRDVQPVQRKFSPNTPILDLVKSVYPSYELSNHPLIDRYGYGTFGSVCEKWYWNDNLSEVSDGELWKIFALIQADWLSKYEYWYNNEVYEFRKYKREHT